VGTTNAYPLVSGRSRYQVLLKFLPLIGVVIFVYIISQLDIPAVIQIFASLNPLYIVLSFFSIVPLLFIVNFEWQMILKRQGIHVSSLYSMKNLLIGYFYGFITPGGVGGYLQILYLKQECHEPLPKCASNIITLHTIDLITLLFFAIAGGVLLTGQFPIFLIIFVLLLALIMVLFFFLLGKKGSQPFFKRLLQTRVLRYVQRYFKDPLESFFDELPSFRALILPFIVSIMAWLLYFTEFYLVSRLFMIDVPFLYFILMAAITNVVTLIPISIYGLGTREATMISLFSLFGIPKEQIVSLSLFWFVLIWMIPSLAGAFVTLREHKRLDSLRSQAIEKDS
jgi:glycosyltransferase 2 family protein